LISIVEQVDLTTPQGRAMAQSGAVFAELERAPIGQRTAEALQLLRAQGRVYGPVPYGFTTIAGKLVEDVDEQAVLRQIHRLRTEGVSYARIAAKLNAAGSPAKRGGDWHAMSVRSVARTTACVAGAEAA
jgi:site-specific DNA recombinase